MNYAMADIAPSQVHSDASHPLHSSNSSGKWFLPLFGLVLFCVLGYVAYALARDLTTARSYPSCARPGAFVKHAV
ncbi:hypothetical protein ACCS86_37565, partial [Rhizobium ruizarguesonis]